MRVLISGAGIAGPTAAWFLAKAGAHVTVVEKASALLPHGQNVDIEGSAVHVIQRMGLLDEVRCNNTTEKGMKFIDPKNRPYATFPVRKDGFGVSGSSEFEILRGDLAKLLYEATKHFENVEYLFDTTIKEVISNDDEYVQVTLSNGNQQEFDVLIAADGQWSNIRKQCFRKDAVTVSDRGMYAVYWTIPRQADDDEWWNIYQALDSRMITMRPDPYGTMRAMFTCYPRDEVRKQSWEDASRGDRLTQEKLVQREFIGAGWNSKRYLDSISNAPDFYFQSMKQIVMPKWHSGRIVCLGDAAYCPTSTSGMGTTSAIMGAYVLAGELSKLKDGEHPVVAFEEHERIYRPVINELQPAPKAIVRFVHADRAWKRWIFQTAIFLVSRLVAFPWVAARLHQTDENVFPLPEYPMCEKEAV